MKLSIISFGPNPRIVAKFQTDRLRTLLENPIKKVKKPTPSKTYTLAAATLRYADTAGSITLWCHCLECNTCRLYCIIILNIIIVVASLSSV